MGLLEGVVTNTGGTGGKGPMPTGHFKMLVFQETRGYHHDAIAAGVQMLTELSAQNDFAAARILAKSRARGTCHAWWRRSGSTALWLKTK